MYLLRIEHSVADFAGWKKAFDNDPVDRRKSGVLRYRIMRLIDDTDYIMIDLEFDSRDKAQALLTNLRAVWGNVQGKVILNPKARIAEAVETKEY
jgi:ribosomal protein L35AE/L33A